MITRISLLLALLAAVAAVVVALFGCSESVTSSLTTGQEAQVRPAPQPLPPKPEPRPTVPHPGPIDTGDPGPPSVPR
jgi:hypothetical protein